MKISSTVQPIKPFEIIKSGNKCTAIFYTNIVSNPIIDGMTGNSLPSWDYEKYELGTSYSTTLSAQIEADYNTWLQKAKDNEESTEAKKVRDYRDSLLNECDLKHCNPEKWMIMSDDEKLSWGTYKQSLRDIPAQKGFPYHVIWPVIPADTTGNINDAITKATNEKKQVAYNAASQLAVQAYIAQKGDTTT